MGNHTSLFQMPRSPREQRQLVFTSEIQEKDEDYRISFRIKRLSRREEAEGWEEVGFAAENRRSENLSSLSCHSERMGENSEV